MSAPDPPRPHFQLAPPPGDTRGVALVLHGGRERSERPVRAHNLAVVRMTPFATSLSRAGRHHGLAVARLRYAVRGWNGASRSPVADVSGALDQIAEAYPGTPVALVGHSMGGRSAIYLAGHQVVSSVVALAPWIEKGDPFRQFAGRDVLVVHGTRDRTTSPRAAHALVHDLQGLARSATFVRVHQEGHAMLRRPRLWHELATGYVLARLCGVPPRESVHGDAANVLTKALAGTTDIDV